MANDQMVIAKPNPIPTPIGSPAEAFDDVWWYVPRMPGELRKGRTLELRIDLIHTSADDLFATLWCMGHSGASETAYIVYFDRNEVALGKYMYPGNGVGMTFFYWDTLPTVNENVNVRLALTRTDEDTVNITVKVVDKGNQHATLYERSFVDGPEQDAPVPPPDPHGLGLYIAPDSGRPHTDFTGVGVACWQLIYTTPPPLEVVLDNLEVYEGASLDIERPMLLSWSVNTEEEEQILVTTDSLTSPVWTPWPEPIFKRFHELCSVAPVAKKEQYFQLVPGKQFLDDFSAVPAWPFTARADWTLLYANPNDTNKVHWRIGDDSLWIYTPSSSMAVDGRVWAVPPRAEMAVKATDFEQGTVCLCVEGHKYEIILDSFFVSGTKP